MYPSPVEYLPSDLQPTGVETRSVGARTGGKDPVEGGRMTLLEVPVKTERVGPYTTKTGGHRREVPDWRLRKNPLHLPVLLNFQ